MLEAKELRIGNYVNEVEDGLLVIDAINKGVGERFSIESNNELHNSDFLRPIPLTEEWLLKFGGEEVGIDMYGVKRYDFNRLNIGYKEHFFIDDEMPTDVVIKYVHQLQNLVFALTGEELEIKEYEIRNRFK